MQKAARGTFPRGKDMTDTGAAYLARHKKRITPLMLAVFILIAALGIGAGAGCYIYYRDNVGMPPDTQAEAEYELISESYVTIDDNKPIGPIHVPKAPKAKRAAWDVDNFDAPALDINMEELKMTNPDFIGWLYCGQFGISYPLVQEHEIDEYVHLTFNRQPSEAGCVFMDVLSRGDFSGYSDFLFAHNMRNLTMFGPLKKVVQDGGISLITNDPYIYVYTPTQTIRYRIFAFYRTTIGSRTYDEIIGPEQYDEFVEYIKGLSEYPLPEGVSFEDRPEILTMSTCHGMPGGDKRLVIHTVKCGVKHLGEPEIVTTLRTATVDTQ